LGGNVKRLQAQCDIQIGERFFIIGLQECDIGALVPPFGVFGAILDQPVEFGDRTGKIRHIPTRHAFVEDRLGLFIRRAQPDLPHLV